MIDDGVLQTLKYSIPANPALQQQRKFAAHAAGIAADDPSITQYGWMFLAYQTLPHFPGMCLCTS
jgi:hypothetical protein